MNRQVLLLLLFLLATTIGAVGSDGSVRLNSRRISVQDGLLGNTVNELVQDKEGYLWLATNNGLTRYDGYSVLNYTTLGTDADHPVETRIGRIFKDETGHRLWLNTATYQDACYDLRQARFVDWWDADGQAPRHNKLQPTTRGMLLYGTDTGATLCGSTDGKPWTQHYAAKDGSLPSDEVLMVVEDSAHNIFMPTTSGVAVIAAGSRKAVQAPFAQHSPVIAAATTGSLTCFLTADGQAVVADQQLNVVRRSALPAALGLPRRVNVSFVWQGRWMLFTPDGTLTMDLADGSFQRPATWQVSDALNQGQCEGWHFVANRSGQLWLFPSEGPARTLSLLPNARFSTSKGRKFFVSRAADSLLFIATYGNGLFVYNTRNDALTHFSAGDAVPVIHSDYLLCSITDRRGSVWVGSETTGAYCLSLHDSKTARYVQPQPQHKGDWSNTISSISLEGGNVVVGTRDGLLYQATAADYGSIRQLAGGQPSAITVRMTDSGGHVWVGTWGNGVYRDGKRMVTPRREQSFTTDFVSDIAEDREGRLWVATWDGMLLLRDTTFVQYMADDINTRRVNDLELLPDGTLWVATNNGVCRWNGRDFDVFNTANKLFPHSEVHMLCADGDHTLWAGTAGGGIVKCSLGADGGIGHTQLIDMRQGLANNNVASVVLDRQGFLWAGTENGLSRINTATGVVSSFRFADTPQGNVMANGCAVADSTGSLLFGTDDGLLVVNPGHISSISLAKVQASAALTDLLVNGQSVYELSLLSQALSSTRRIDLAHRQNSLSLRFSNFSYDHREMPVYQYYLEGLEHEWNSATTQNHADYVELQPGRYTFHLRSLSEQGEWSGDTTLLVVIAQPWWNTWWAWLLYLLVAALLAWYVWSNWKEKFDLHQQMKLERQLNDFRTQLFTHIAHEFRTPLAIIKGAVDKLQGDRATLQTAQRGTKRLLRLVNQFMEFRKARTSSLHLHVQQGDIVGFVKNIYQDFWPLAKQKNLQLTFTPFERKRMVLFDEEMVETIVYNLLSNAIKYTPEGGSVAVYLKSGEWREESGERNDCSGEWRVDSVEFPTGLPGPHDGRAVANSTLSTLHSTLNNGNPVGNSTLYTLHSTLRIIVEDSGPGITAEQQRVLFQPFMQGLASQGGMGIGLYTAQQMAQTHHGSLTYEQATPEGGSRFVFTLPADDSVYTADEMIARTAPRQQEPSSAESDDIIKQMKPEALNDLSIAIIEDDPDMMEQISSEMGVYFRTHCYSNGQRGFEGVSANVPAMLICDVMLPDMNGYDIVRKLKSLPATKHLPVIMLTALDDETHQLKAYQAGADDFMVKPCNWRLLVARTMQLIKWERERLNFSLEFRVESVEFATALDSGEWREERGEFATAHDSGERREESGKFATALPSSGNGNPVGNSKLYTLNSTLNNGNGNPVGNSTLYTQHSKLKNDSAPLINSQADKLFLDRLAMHVAQHLREEDFNVDQLAQLLSMGRTKFYGRVKELTGLSPNKYLLQERMKKAADLLADGELTVSEVSYQVGIQDPSYFNKCFKSFFGVTPKKYVRPTSLDAGSPC